MWKNFRADSYRGWDIGPRKSKNHRGGQALFWGEKFGYANYTSFERAHRAESNDTEINEIRPHMAELQTPEILKFLGSKNSNMQIIAHSKGLDELSWMTPKSPWLDKIRQSYDTKNLNLWGIGEALVQNPALRAGFCGTRLAGSLRAMGLGS